MGLAALYCAVQVTSIEKPPNKPFNPLLGETFEFISPGKFKFLAEQVSHHPPVTAFINIGDSGYLRYSTVRIKSKFSKGNFLFNNMYKEYLEFLPHNEVFEVIPAAKSVHNLIIGTPYLEASGKSYLINKACPKDQYAELEYFKRGWSESTYHRVTGNVYSSAN